MKTKIIKHFLWLAVLPLLWGCSSEENFLSEEYPLMLSAQVEGASAPIPGSVSDIGDVGVFVSGGISYNNAKYTGTSGRLTPQKQGYWGSTGNISIYAYAPYQTGSLTSVSVKTDQSLNSNYTASDFLYAASETFTFANRNNISLTFKHHLSRINLTLVTGDGVNAAELSNATIQITGANTTATITLSGVLMTPNNIQAITPNGDGTNKYKAIVIPQTVSAGTALFEATIGARSFEYILPVEQKFRTGEQYNYTLTLSQGGITVSPAEIIKWTEDLKDNNGIAN
ncbi:fimbrillin family protein [Dysgonomonas sp. BGC7]|uniref:fimbrillin family protein n=1 Tax=Dysgonomonas sp. BGC7 TaxID=1658008 RepID=UPI000682FEBD|nr:fimbrillin family protein [Dysgonomonas sp. BGC7]MBD8387782.1 fimbrillin family protein [Dysgonomonas sp. BGC7]